MKQKIFVKSFNKNDLEEFVNLLSKNFEGLFRFENVKNSYEFARLKFKNGTLVVYSSGKVVLSHFGLDEVEDFIISLESNDYNVMIGIDETGKGELFGSIIVCAVRIEKNKKEIEKIVSTSDTKKKLSLNRYEYLFNKLKELGVNYIVKEILPKDILEKKTNKILSNVYLELVYSIIKEEDKGKRVRIVLDDFGITSDVRKSIEKKCSFADLIIEHRADDKYVECKTASIISRYHREVFIKKINEEYSIDGIVPGYGNLSDAKTFEWLKKWLSVNGSLPSFVKPWKNVIEKNTF